MSSLSGHLLVAAPQLNDPNFVHTVVLLVQHTDEGALGLVLNRPTSKTVKELWKEIGDAPCESSRPVHLGGPVSGPLMAVHRSVDLAELEVIPGVFFSAKKINLDRLVVQQGHAFKMFVGHAGWGPGQLEGELEVGAWFTREATPELVFYEGDDLWERVLREIHRTTLQSVLNLKHIPEDPSLN